MADWDYDTAGPGRPATPGRARRVETAVRLAGAAVSVALVAGLGVWSYQLAMRQLHGVPVIAAPEGLARTPPADPGGELAQHQGLQVNRIAAVGEAEGSAESLTLAPRPTELAPEDTASDALRASLGTPLAAPARPEGSPRVVEPSEAMRATLGAPAQVAEPLPDEAAEPIMATDLAVMEALGMTPEGLIDATEPGLARSLRPRQRPTGDAMAAVAAEAVAASLAPGGQIDVDPATLAPGTTLAQIGSYETEAQAKLEWDKAVARFGALMEGKNRVIQAAESGGRTFFRLRVAGFADKDDARRFCAAFQSGGQCVPALVR